MKVTRFSEATPYVAPHHYDMRSLRLQGYQPGGPQAFWTGLSHFLPGGGAGPDASSVERVYVMLAGELTVTAGDTVVALRPMDSCCIQGGEIRTVRNDSNEVATMLVVMPYQSRA